MFAIFDGNISTTYPITIFYVFLNSYKNKSVRLHEGDLFIVSDMNIINNENMIMIWVVIVEYSTV